MDMLDASWAEMSSGGSAAAGPGPASAAAAAANVGLLHAAEAKRDKRRREMVERVERLRRDTIDRKDAIYSDLHTSFGHSLHAILAQPVPEHPEYLLRLHAYSVERDAALLQSRLEATYALETANQLYENEVERVEDEYEQTKKLIKEKLLEACDERVKKLREEKDALEMNLESMFDLQPKAHTTRRSRGNNGNAAGASSSLANGSYSATNGVGISGVSLPLPSDFATHGSASPMIHSSSFQGAGTTNNGNASPLPNIAGSQHSHLNDLFSFSLLPSSPALGNKDSSHLNGQGYLSGNTSPFPSSMFLLQPNSSAFASLRSGYHRAGGPGQGRAKAGYPPNGVVIPPGTYALLGKSIGALNGLRAEEIGDDMEGMRRKKKRTAAGEGGRNGKRQHAAAHEMYP